MLSHRGFSAWISVDDEALPEYLVAVDGEAHQVSCWIPGEEGKTFTVWWRDHGSNVDTCSFITLDGLVVPGRFLLGNGIASRSGARASHFTERPFTFMRVPESTDDNGDSKNELGTVVLRIKRVTRIASRPSNPLQTLPPSTVAGKRKAGDLCVGFGPEQAAPLQYSSTWQVAPYDKSPKTTSPSTYVSFVFRYRSSDFLEAQGIATEVKKKLRDPRVGDERRVASLPLLPSTAILVTPSPSPPKRPKLTEPVPNDQAALGHRRPSANLRRAVSYRTRPLKAEPDNYSHHQSLFLLPRNESQRPSLGLQPPMEVSQPSTNSSLSDATSEDEPHRQF